MLDHHFHRAHGTSLMCTLGQQQWGRGAGYRGRLTPEGRSTLARNEGSRAPHGSPDSTSQNATSRAQHNRPRCSTSSAQSPASASRWGRSYMRQSSPPASGLPRVLCVVHCGGDLHAIHTAVRVTLGAARTRTGDRRRVWYRRRHTGHDMVERRVHEANAARGRPRRDGLWR